MMKFVMFVLFVLTLAGYALAAAAAAAAAADGDDDDDCCSAEDRHELQFIWRRVWASAFTARREAIAGAVFEDFFKHYPSSKGLFQRVKVDNPDSPEFRAHLLRVTNGLDSVISLLDAPLVLHEHLDHLADQHVERKGITKAHFEGFGKSFARILPQVVSCFNVHAFERCYSLVAGRISRDLP